MGNSYDAMFRKFEQHENATRFTAGMTPAERGDFYGRMLGEKLRRIVYVIFEKDIRSG